MKRLSRVISGTTAAVLSLSSMLTLGFTGVAQAAVQTCTWSGATDAKFSTATNWTNCGGGVPQAGDIIELNSTALTADKALTQDITGLAVGGITVINTETDYSKPRFAYTLSGDLHVAGNITLGSSLTLIGTVTLDGDVTVGGTGARLDMNDAGTTLVVGAHKLTIAGGYNIPGKITGTAAGSLVFDGGDFITPAILTNFGGSIMVKKGSFKIDKNLSATAPITVMSGATLVLCGFNGAAIANPLTVGGEGTYASGALMTASACVQTGGGGGGGGGGGVDAVSTLDPQASADWTGPVNLTANTTVGGSGELTISGALSGKFTLTMLPGQLGKLVIAASPNTSATPNGVAVSELKTMELKDTSGNQTAYIVVNTLGILTGKYNSVGVYAGGTLKGDGGTVVNGLFVESKAIIAPGMSPGCITAGTLQLDGEYQFEIGGKEACTGYDQIKITGTTADSLNIGETAVLKVARLGDFTPAKGDSFVIISQAGSQAVKGAFSGLPEGATVEVDGVVYKVSYKGGDGNDVTLTVENSPTAPDTGFALTTASPALTLGLTVAAALSLLTIARRVRPAHAHATTKRRK